MRTWLIVGVILVATIIAAVNQEVLGYWLFIGPLAVTVATLVLVWLARSRAKERDVGGALLSQRPETFAGAGPPAERPAQTAEESAVFDQGGVVVTGSAITGSGRTFPLSGDGKLHRLVEYPGRWQADAVIGFGALVVVIGLFPPTPLFFLTGAAIIAVGAWWHFSSTPTFHIVWRTLSSEGFLVSSRNERWIEDILSAVRRVRPDKV